MRKYLTTYMRESYYSVEIEAENIDQAREKAWDIDTKDLEHDYDSGVFKIVNVTPKIGLN